MAVTLNGTSQYYINSSWAGPTAAPFTVSCWANTNSTVTSKFLVNINFDTTNFFALFMTAGGAIFFRAHDGTFTDASTINTMGADAWHFAAGRADSSTSRFAFVDTQKGTESTASHVPTAPDEVAIGISAAAGNFWNGEIAEVAFWSRALSDDEMLALAAGYSALFFMQGLEFYWQGRVLGEDDYFGHVMTETASPTKIEDYPPIIYPSTAPMFPQPAAAGAATVVGPPLRYVKRRRIVVA